MLLSTHLRRGLHRLGLLVLLLLALGVYAPAALAQDRSVEVTRRDGDITIQSNGDVQVVETWQTRFIGGPFRFAFRSIPLDRITAIDGWGVSENEQAYQPAGGESPGTFKVEQVGTERKITWYFTPTSDATRTFALRYTLHGVVRIYQGGDQLFLKFIERARSYPIDAARVTLHLPGAFEPAQIKAASYLDSSEERERPRVLDGRTIEFSGGPFAPDHEWEVRAQFPHGVVTSAAPAWQPAFDQEQQHEAAIAARRPLYNLAALAISTITLLGGALGLYLLWYKRGRDAPVGEIAPYYATPPEDVPPGVIGTLLDERADMKDITATLVDLARRGFVQIVEEQSGTWFESTDFLFVRGPGDQSALRSHEQRLLDRLFPAGMGERRLSSLKNSFYSEIPQLKSDLYDETVRQGYFDKNPASTRNNYTALGVLALLLAVAVGVGLTLLLGQDTPLIVLLGIVLGLLAIGFLILSRSMSRKTAAGAAAAAKWRGFKRYLEQLDRYTTVDTAKDQFDRYLPYAIAFGIERGWVKRFEAVNTPAPQWYYPYGYYPYYGGGHPHRRASTSDNDQSWGGQPGRGAPSLDQAAGGAFRGLSAISSGFFTMLNSTASVFTSQPQSSGGGDGSWSGGGGGGGGGSGGGSSGFG